MTTAYVPRADVMALVEPLLEQLGYDLNEVTRIEIEPNTLTVAVYPPDWPEHRADVMPLVEVPR